VPLVPVIFALEFLDGILPAYFRKELNVTKEGLDEIGH
jgi:hypothetical protein